MVGLPAGVYHFDPRGRALERLRGGDHRGYLVRAVGGELAAAGAECLRADFVYRRYEPAEVRRIWRLVRAGRPVAGGHAANFDRGIL